MKEFNLWEFGHLVDQLEHLAATLTCAVTNGSGATKDADFYDQCLTVIVKTLTYAKAQKFRDCYKVALASESHLRIVDPNADISTLAADIRHVRDALLGAVYDQKFLRVDWTRTGYVDHPHLFGEKVADAFPSAIPDIRESGNCLAADCNTAAVFHMMRVVEWGLRALCVSLGFRRLKQKVKKSGAVSYTPIEYSEWEKILNQLQDRIDAKTNKIKRGPVKQQHQEFYYPALQDIRAIRDAWRNHVMHTRRKYAPKDADAILEHVKRLMNTLAGRIREV